jgi:hypothetical protein
VQRVCQLPLRGYAGGKATSEEVKEAVELKTEDRSALVQGRVMLSNQRIRHDLRVAYELLLDAKRRNLLIADVVLAQQDQSRTPPLAQSILGLLATGSSTPPLGSSINVSLGSVMGNASVVSQQTSQQLQLPAKRRRLDFKSESLFYHMFYRTHVLYYRWYLGIQSKKDPASVMSEVYKALFALDCRWHQVTLYRVLCLWQPPCAEECNVIALLLHVVIC